MVMVISLSGFYSQYKYLAGEVFHHYHCQKQTEKEEEVET